MTKPQSTFTSIRKSLKNLADPTIAKHSNRFFKTGKGEYGEGDIFLGIRVPVIRKEVKNHKTCTLETAIELLHSKFHEERLFALIMCVEKFSKGTPEEQKVIYELYLKNRAYINNWDLVDTSAHHIVGPYLEHRDKKILYKLAKSADLWERRIAMLTTYYFIRKNKFEDAIKIAVILKDDPEDLIHKAVGWMLREIGKRNPEEERKFLNQYYKTMPRTMLRYAIEKFPEKERKAYLKGTIPLSES